MTGFVRVGEDDPGASECSDHIHRVRLCYQECSVCPVGPSALRRPPTAAEAPARRVLSRDPALEAGVIHPEGGSHSCAPYLSFLTSRCFFSWTTGPRNTVAHSFSGFPLNQPPPRNSHGTSGAIRV